MTRVYLSLGSNIDRERNVIDVRYDGADIVEIVRHHLANGRYSSEPLYGDGNAGARIANLLADAPLTVKTKIIY